MAKIIHIPAHLRDLQKPFFPKPVEPAVEFLVRHAAFLDRRNKRFAYYSLGESRYHPFEVDEQTAARFEEVCKQMFFPRNGPQEANERSGQLLERFLAGRGVQMVELVRRHYLFYELTRETLEILPCHHFGHSHFKQLLLGRNIGGGLNPHWSQYSDPVVDMYVCAITGPMRTYFALLLHEIGHSFASLLGPQDLAAMRALFSSAAGLFGVDYLSGEESRKEMACMGMEEFIAENYMHYVTQSDRLAAFLETVTPRQRAALAQVWSIYNKHFDGILYV